MKLTAFQFYLTTAEDEKNYDNAVLPNCDTRSSTSWLPEWDESVIPGDFWWRFGSLPTQSGSEEEK